MPSEHCRVAARPQPTVESLRSKIEDVVARVVEQCAEYQRACEEQQRPRPHRSNAAIERQSHAQLNVIGASLEELLATFTCTTAGDAEEEDAGEEPAGHEAAGSRKRSSALSPIHYRYDITIGEPGEGEDETRDGSAAVDDDALQRLSALVLAPDLPRTPARTLQRALCFPKPKTKAAHCTNVLCAMSVVYVNLRQQQSITKRALYYRQVDIARKQAVVDRAIDTLCAILEVQRGQLQVVASARGLVCGELSFVLSDDPTVVDCRSSVLVPAFCAPVQLSIVQPSSALQYVLVVEKHSVYNALLAHRFHLDHHCIVVTGKGFPCYSTREFLLRVHEAMPALPVFALVDCDPYGLSIYSVYKHGSARSRLERLTLPAMRLLGLLVGDVVIMQQRVKEAGSPVSLGLQPLTAKEQRKLRLMMADEPAHRDDGLLAQLEAMSEFAHKAELECVDAYAANFLVTEYIPRLVARALQSAVACGADEEPVDEGMEDPSDAQLRRLEACERLRSSGRSAQHSTEEHPRSGHEEQVAE